MRRIIALILALCAFGAPSAAQAWPTNLETYSINSGIQSGGDNTVEQFNATLYDYSIRPAMDRAAVSSNSLAAINAVYGAGLDGLAHNGVGVLPIMDWSDGSEPDGKKDIDTSAERTDWQAFVKNATTAVNTAYANNGVAKPGAVEIWNEPNCDDAFHIGSDPTPVLDEYWNNVYVPAFNGVRQVSSDTNVVVGGLAAAAASNMSCNDAPNWISAIISRGYSSQVNAYAIHAYGFSISGDTTQGQDIADEIHDSCLVSNRKLLLTETGVSSADGHNEAYQKTQTETARTQGYDETRLRSNWPGVDKTSGFTPYRRTMGLWYPGPSYTAKQVEADWRSWASFHGRVGTLDNTGPTC